MEAERNSNLSELMRRARGSRSQQWVADRCGVSQQTVSAWESGTNPERAHLALFAIALDEDPNELAEAAGYYPEEIKLLFDIRVVTTEDIEHALAGLNRIQEVRARGESRDAMAWSLELSNWLEKKEKRVYDEVKRQRISIIRGQVLLSGAESSLDFLLPLDLLQRFETIVRVVDKIARDCDDRGLRTWIECGLGAVYNTTEIYAASLEHYSAAVELPMETDAQIAVEAALALNWAYLDEEGKAKEHVEAAEDLIKQGKFLHSRTACHAYQVLARAQANLKSEMAFDTINKGRDMLVDLELLGGKIPMNDIQFASSELEVAQHLQPSDPAQLIDRANNALHRAEEYKFQRHERRIRRRLRKIEKAL